MPQASTLQAAVTILQATPKLPAFTQTVMAQMVALFSSEDGSFAGLWYPLPPGQFEQAEAPNYSGYPLDASITVLSTAINPASPLDFATRLQISITSKWIYDAAYLLMGLLPPATICAF
jgi:hypothetical protein